MYALRMFLVLLLFGSAAYAAEPVDVKPAFTIVLHVDHPGLSKLAWQLACPSVTFSPLTCFEMIDLLHSQGIHHIELSPGQPLSPDRRNVLVSHNMAPADLDA